MKIPALIPLTALLLGPSAMAATSLSGNYAVSYTQTCQLVVDINKATGAMKIDRQSAKGTDASGPGVITFDPAEGTYDWNGTIDGVSVVLEHFSDGSKKGKQGNSYPFEESGTYSNTDSTLTLQGLAYDVVYSGIDQNGLAHGFMATLHLPLKHLPADHCLITLQGLSQ